MPGDDATSYLVRHAKAAARERWTAPDRDRPLTDAGRLQAAGLAKMLAPRTRSIMSSPYLRCVQTVAPLAAAVRLRVEEEERLAEGADPSWAIAELAATPGAVLCTHGDVMASIVISLTDAKVPMAGGKQWGKAGTWEFTIADGRILRGRYLPPPV
ncbi:MAG: SixA phosphatase family protein [Candidatus Dormibacteria bacterium]